MANLAMLSRGILKSALNTLFTRFLVAQPGRWRQLRRLVAVTL
jgi:hypothetical protein